MKKTGTDCTKYFEAEHLNTSTADYVHAFEEWLTQGNSLDEKLTADYNTTFRECLTYRNYGKGDFYVCPDPISMQDGNRTLVGFGTLMNNCNNGMTLVDRRAGW